MVDSPIIFTSEEQAQLQQLQQQVNGFGSFKNLVARSLYQGQDAAVANDLLNFLGNLATQAAEQIKKVEASAKDRSSAETSKAS